MIEITITTDYITLGQFLKFVGIISSGSESKSFLKGHIVFVNQIKEDRRGKKLFIGDQIEIDSKKYCIRGKSDN